MASEFSTESELVAEGLACRRGERLVFAGLECRLPAGGALVLSGGNGSGKSSLLRLLATLLAPAAGRLLWGGVPVLRDAASYRARIHYVGHLDATKPALSPREMLGFWATLRGSATPEIEPALGAFALVIQSFVEPARTPSRWTCPNDRASCNASAPAVPEAVM